MDITFHASAYILCILFMYSGMIPAAPSWYFSCKSNKSRYLDIESLSVDSPARYGSAASEEEIEFLFAVPDESFFLVVVEWGLDEVLELGEGVRIWGCGL